MLQSIRSNAGSWIVKILFGLLVVSFALWGIGDLFINRGPDQTVAEVGDVDIAASAVERPFQAELNQVRQVFGPEFDAPTAVQMGLHRQALDRLISSQLFDLMAADLGLVVSEDAAVARIQQNPAFQDDVTGRFSLDRFRAILAASGISEQEYVNGVRQDLARESLLGAIGAGAAAPEFLAERLLRYRAETRTAQVVSIPDDLPADVPEPTEQEIQAYYGDEANRDALLAPEYRVLSILTLNAADLADEVAVDEAELLEEYEARRDAYTHEERRRFAQVILGSEEQAAQVAEAVAQGQTLEAAAQAVDPSKSVVEIDWSTRDEMSLPELAEAGFALAEGAVSAPVRSPFGWHVLQVTGIEPAGTEPFEAVRDDIEAELRLERAIDANIEFSDDVVDAFAGGATFEEVAQQFNLPLVQTPPVTARGVTGDGTALPDLPAMEEALQVGFALGDGEESDLEAFGEGDFFIVRVDEVIEPAVPPLAEIRDEVVEAIMQERRHAAAVALAETVAQRIRDGAAPEAAAAEVGAETSATPALLRDGSNRGTVPQPVVDQLFTLDPGEMTVVEVEDAVLIVQLTDIAEPEPSENAEVLASIEDDARQAIAADLMAQYTEALRDRFDVDIDEEALDRYFGQF